MSFYKFIRLVTYPVVKLLWPTKVVHKERFDKLVETGGVVVCNHYAIPDTLIPAASLYKEELNVLAKQEAFDCAKIANWFLTKMGAIPIKRGVADINAYKRSLQVLREGRILTLYPEGTRNKEGTKELLEFKQGAARLAIRAQKAILPMVYYRMHKVFRRNYLYIGEPIALDEFYGCKHPDDYERATALVYAKMNRTREECDRYVEDLKKKKRKPQAVVSL